MRRLLFEIAYQGTRYHGYQVQANALTVAQVVQDAVEKVFGRREGITGCSRTDAGVHAGQYFFHMDTGSRIPVDAAVRAMNVNLPGDIAVLSCREVPPSFHARYSVLWKEYTYKIWNAPVRSPFYDGLMLMHPYPLDEALMDRCAKEFIGTHDFRGFCSTGSKAKPTILDGGESTVRTVFAASVRRDPFINWPWPPGTRGPDRNYQKRGPYPGGGDSAGGGTLPDAGILYPLWTEGRCLRRLSFHCGIC